MNFDKTKFPVGCCVKYVGPEYFYNGDARVVISPFILTNGSIGVVTENHEKEGIRINIVGRDLIMSKKTFTYIFEKIEQAERGGVK